jgi:C-terminal four TMM region of protein-O-mannosyltransferase
MHGWEIQFHPVWSQPRTALQLSTSSPDWIPDSFHSLAGATFPRVELSNKIFPRPHPARATFARCAFVLGPALLDFMFRRAAWIFSGKSALAESSLISSRLHFQGQYFSGGNFRIYLLGNPVVWWSNLAFLAMFLLTYFIAAIKQQRGYDADEQAEAKSE